MWYKNGVEYTEKEIKAGSTIGYPSPFSPEGYDYIFENPKPSVTSLQIAVKGGSEIDGIGNRVRVWTIQDIYSGETKAADDAALLLSILTAQLNPFIIQVDADIDAIYAQVIGRRDTEYLVAEEQAAAYIAAAYTGIVPAYVQSWADATVNTTALTATQAADNIAATAVAWRAVQDSMRAARLLHKQNATAAADIAALDVVKASWAAYLIAIKTSLGI